MNGISDKETAALVYHNICLLQEENDVNSFSVMLKETMAQLKNSSTTVGFAKYFETNYAKRAEEWAACFRKSSNITNNYVCRKFSSHPQACVHERKNQQKS